MISLILPYWDRQQAADDALALLDKHYRDLDLEVIVVDDGNRVPFKLPETGLDVRVIRLPVKDKPTSPLHAWNVGVREARGALIALSCIEILHDSPVLAQMAGEIRGKWDYVLAAAWCPEQQAWHCHSTVNVPGCPKGTGIGFMAMMSRYLFDAAGGFDEDYMKGAGYEDRDWINRLVRAGAHFVMRDDLVVTHPKKGASIAWESEGFARNAMLFADKWPGAQRPITFVCLKAGTAYGPEYVNILKDMVSRNLTEGFPGKFVCITDDPAGLDEGVEVLPLPADLETWWGKLYMFKRGLFPDGTRCLFMDLDTIIIGNLDAIASYQGQFATLRDFLFPQQVGPAIIAWEAGDFAASIWDEWVACGKPKSGHGDLWWINNLDQGRFVKEIDILQDLFPGKFVSYKAGCHPYPPRGTAVVCFHGQPKPHNCGAAWVQDVWRIGGGVGELVAICNTGRATVDFNVREALKRDMPWLSIKPEHGGQVVIVSGGPSIEKTLGEIRWRKGLGQEVWAVNGACHWLNEKGIIPDAHIVIDARPENCHFLKAQSKKQYLASQCAPQTFRAASNPIGLHMNTEGMADLLPDGANMISSGSTVGLAAIAVAYVEGFRVIHLHGYDSSFDGQKHAYRQRFNDEDLVVDAVANGRTFKSTPWMVKQVQEFQDLASQLAEVGAVITVAGDGLLPWVARCMTEEACSA